VIHRHRYVQCVVLSFFKIILNSLISAQNSYIITVNLNMSYTILVVRYAASKNVCKRATKTVIHSKSSPLSMSPHKALLYSHSVCFLGTLAFAPVRFFASAWC